MRTFVRIVLLLAVCLALVLPVSAAAGEGKGKEDRVERQEKSPREEKARERARKEQEEREKKARERAEREARRAEKEARHDAEKAEDEAEGEKRPLPPDLPARAIPPTTAGPAPSPGASPSAQPAPGTIVAPPAPAGEPLNPRRFGYGASVADLGRHGATLRGMGFDYVKAYMPWSGAEPAKGRYQWVAAPNANDANNIVSAAEQQGLRVVLRVDMPPGWAAPGSGNRPPTNPSDYGDFMGALASYLRGRVVAYELWNEPNLASEWGNQAPSPEHYTLMLQDAYRKIKAADPGALVVTGGLATTGGDGGATAMDDLEFMRRMYAAGAKGYFDAFGSHPYGFADAPAALNANGVTHFRRAADQYQVMVEHGDGDKAVWATEVGWIVDPSAYGHPEYLDDPLWAGRQWQRVSPEQQAAYLVQAYQYAYENWPWMGVMLLFNLDFATVGYYTPAEQMRWYGVLGDGGAPRPAYDALRTMAKPIR